MLQVIDREEDYAKALEVYGQKQIVGQKELRQLEPSLSLHLLGAVQWPACMSLNPLKTMLAMKKLAQAEGVVIHETCPDSPQSGGRHVGARVWGYEVDV